MNDEKIKVSIEEVNSLKVDEELHRINVAQRMAEHQDKIRQEVFNNTTKVNSKNNIFQKAIVYMSIFGFVFSSIGWIVGEGIQSAMTDKYLNQAWDELQFLDRCWFILLCCLIAIGISIAENCAERNFLQAIKNALLGGILGIIGGFLVSLFINGLYRGLGGGNGSNNILQQIFARSVGWGIFGAFVAIAPGIMMKSWKKFLLGLLGGAIGGLVGGILFDPICLIFKSDVIARFINIIALGVGAAFATVYLENVAKQGWLKVAMGVIAGKQFILYRNPTIIGSSPKCEIYLFKDPQVMPKHAAINNKDGEYYITSLNNADVYINDQLIIQQRLKSGDNIKIGNTVFVFEAKRINTEKN